MKRPLTGLVVAYASGILVGSWCGWPLVWLCTGAVALVGAFFLFRRSALLWLALICAGMWAYRFSTTNSEPNHITRLLSYRDQNVSLHGVIDDDPGYRDAEEGGQRHSFKLRLTGPTCGTVLMFVSEAREQMPLRYGDEIECTALLRVPPPASNPGTFDWRQWLARQNIQFTATIRKMDDCRILASNRGNPVIALSLRLREEFERALRVGLEDQPRLAGVLAGMLIGERSEIPADTYADFQETGVFHVFAINGLHVGLVTAIVVIFLRLVRVPRRWTAVPAIPLLVLYVFATGAHPGAVRALVMVCVWLMGGMLVRPVDLLSSLALAAFIILIGSPAQLFDGGFILSFTVVLALALLTERSSLWKFLINPRVAAQEESWWMSLVRPDPLIPRELIPRWRRIILRPVLWLILLGNGSLVAWIGLVPLLAVYFHLFTPISIVANLFVIPILGCVLAVGLTSAAVFSVWPAATLILNNANFFLLSVLLKLIDNLGAWRWGHCFVQAPPLWLTITYYALLLAWVWRRLKRRWLAVPVGLFLVVAAWPNDGAEITVLDLRDGVSVFVNLPGEDDDFLIDGGSDWTGERVVLPFLRAQGVDRLAAVMVTRGDKAHAAGLRAVAEHIPVRQAIHSGTGSRSKFFWQWLESVRQRGLQIVTVRAGEERFAGKLKVRALNPRAGTKHDRSDDNSLVLALEYAGTRVLLTSDIGETVERELVAGGDCRAQVLIKGRHSAEQSGTDAFLDAVRPEVVIQSVGTLPSNRYLQPDLRDRLRARGTKFYRTDECGAVTVRLNDTGYTIRTCFATTDAAR